eukprot:Gb_12545 [translate_table: standard]
MSLSNINSLDTCCCCTVTNKNCVAEGLEFARPATAQLNRRFQIIACLSACPSFRHVMALLPHLYNTKHQRWLNYFSHVGEAGRTRHGHAFSSGSRGTDAPSLLPGRQGINI